MILIRSLALVGLALPFAISALSDANDFGLLKIHWPIEPWKLILASFPIALAAYLPWINQAFKQYGFAAVCGIGAAALAIHFALVAVFGVIMFMIGGDTI